MDNETLHQEYNGELVTRAIRKHVIVYVEDLVFHFFGCIAFFAIGTALLISGGFAKHYGAPFFALLVLLTWVSFFAAWTKNYFDVWYITEKHIIAANQKDILEREEAFMELARIQDVFFEKDGILQTFFGYGKLRVQSAGTEQEFVLENVANVEEVAHTIMDLRDTIKHL